VVADGAALCGLEEDTMVEGSYYYVMECRATLKLEDFIGWLVAPSYLFVIFFILLLSILIIPFSRSVHLNQKNTLSIS
jgi:hypothetical protein